MKKIFSLFILILIFCLGSVCFADVSEDYVEYCLQYLYDNGGMKENSLYQKSLNYALNTDGIIHSLTTTINNKLHELGYENLNNLNMTAGYHDWNSQTIRIIFIFSNSGYSNGYDLGFIKFHDGVGAIGGYNPETNSYGDLLSFQFLLGQGMCSFSSYYLDYSVNAHYIGGSYGNNVLNDDLSVITAECLPFYSTPTGYTNYPLNDSSNILSVIMQDLNGNFGNSGLGSGDIENTLPYFNITPSGECSVEQDFSVEVYSEFDLNIDDYYLAITQYDLSGNAEISYSIKDSSIWSSERVDNIYSLYLDDYHTFLNNKKYEVLLISTAQGELSCSGFFWLGSSDSGDIENPSGDVGGNVGSDIEDYLPYFISVPAYPQSNECLVYFYVGDYGLANLSFLIEKLDSNNEILSSTSLSSSIVNSVNYGMAKVDFCKYFKFEDNSFYRFTLIGKDGTKLDTSSIVYFLGSNIGNYEGDKPYIINAPKGYVRNSGDVVVTVFMPSGYDYEDSVYLSVQKYNLSGDYISSTVVGDSKMWFQLDSESGICPIYVSSFCDFDTSGNYYYRINLNEFNNGTLDITDIFYFDIDTGENIDKDNLPINPDGFDGPTLNFDTTDIDSLVNSTTTWVDSIFSFLDIFPSWLKACIMIGITVVVICRILGR